MKRLRVLIVEDSEDDYLLAEQELRAAGYAPVCARVETEAQMREALRNGEWDLVFSDFSMPQFDGMSALEVLRDSPQRHLPFIIVSGSIGELRAVEALKAGAANYVLKEAIDKLGPVVDKELREAQTRAERQEAIEALREAVRARDEFISLASHELKTPLTALRLQLDLLAQLAHGPAAPGPEQLDSRLQVAHRQVERLEGLVGNLLEVSRIHGGRLVLEPEPLDAAEVVRECCAMLEPVRRAAGSPLRLDAGSPAPGLFDRRRLESVVVNLLSNAFKFGRGRPVEVSVARTSEGVRLVVRDQGFGIAPADQQRIFARFERAVSQKHYGGVGIGLWVVRSLAEAHGGKVEVESAVGSGATFTVELRSLQAAGESGSG